jgi:hypothetical protein
MIYIVTEKKPVTQLVIEPMIYHTSDEQANHSTIGHISQLRPTHVVCYLAKNRSIHASIYDWSRIRTSIKVVLRHFQEGNTYHISYRKHISTLVVFSGVRCCSMFSFLGTNRSGRLYRKTGMTGLRLLSPVIGLNLIVYLINWRTPYDGQNGK